MPTTLPWGETVTVLMELGFPVNVFTLNSATDGILDSDYLEGTLIGDDVSAYAQEISINRGRQDQLANFSAGACAVTLLNNDRRFDPTNEASPYWDGVTGRSGVTPRRKVTVRVGDETLFVGRITDIDLSYATGKASDLSTVTVTAADDFVLLANAFTQQSHSPVEELSGARLNYLLSLAEVNYSGPTNIDTGTVALGDYTINANTNALAYAQAISQSEQGFFFMGRDGTLTFTDRVSSAFAAPVGNFSDAVGTGIKYQTLGIMYGQEFLYNKVTTTREGGTTQVANDAASQAEFGISTLSLDGLLLATDATALSLAEDLLNLYAEPVYRFDNMTILASSLNNAQRLTCNTLELGNMITVQRNYASGSPLTVTRYQTIERLTHLITPSVHRLEIAMADAYVVYEFKLDDATYGLLDTDNALA